MRAYECVNKALEEMGREFSTTLELDEDGFVTLKVSANREVTIYAEEDGEAFSMAGALFLVSDELPLELVYRELLEYNMPGNLRMGEALAYSGETVYLVRQLPVDSVDGEALKRHVSLFGSDCDEVEQKLREFMDGLSSGEGTAARTPLPARPDAPLVPESTSEEILRHNMMRQGMRY